MPPPMKIDLSVGGLTSAVGQLQQIARAYQQIASGQRQLSVAGPGASLARAQRQVVLAQRLGDPLQQVDAQIALQRAQQRFQGPTPGQRISRVLSSSRLNLGPISPLLGQLAGGGPAGALLAAAGALRIFTGAVKDAAERARELGDAARISGGTAGEIARLSGMGIPGGEIAGRAAGLRQASLTPYGQVARARLGLAPAVPRPYGSTNEAQALQETLKALRNVTDAEEQLRLARMLQVEDLLKYVNVTKNVQQAQDEIGKTTEAIFNPQAAQEANDLAANWKLVKDAASNLVGIFNAGFIPTLNDFLHNTAVWLNDVAKWLGIDIPNATGKAAAALNGAADNFARALDQGLFGAGARARSAIGAGMQGEFLRHALQGQTLHMGAFGL